MRRVKPCDKHNLMALDIEKLILTQKSKREREGLSLRKLSRLIGVSFSTLARIERGEGSPDNNSALRIINWLGDDAREAGLSFDKVALVHFRASKNTESQVIERLLKVADQIVSSRLGVRSADYEPNAPNMEYDTQGTTVSLSKSEMETMANDLREKVGVDLDAAFPALKLRINGVELKNLADISGINEEDREILLEKESIAWSGMSVPLNTEANQWAIVLNSSHTIERQRVTYLEECWHILLGHRLTRVAKMGNAYGRSYESTEEHDAFFLASATLLPETEIDKRVTEGKKADEIGKVFGTSPELVEYRIKRLGLWSTYKGLQINLSDN